MSDFLRFVNAADSDSSDASGVAEALACLDRFTEAFNARDFAGMDRELHFPHMILAGSERLVWDGPGQHPQDLFATLRKSGWAYTKYESREPVVVAADKVHFAIVYTRRNERGEILSTHRNLWIVTRVNGKWGIALRSY